MATATWWWIGHAVRLGAGVIHLEGGRRRWRRDGGRHGFAIGAGTAGDYQWAVSGPEWSSGCGGPGLGHGRPEKLEHPSLGVACRTSIVRGGVGI